MKIPASTYEFGANLIDSKLMLIGRVLTDGRLSGRIKYDVNDMLSTKRFATQIGGLYTP